METLSRHKGEGWLKAPGLGASTAHYEITVKRRKTGPMAGQYIIAGTVTAELSVLVEAALGRAILTLADGSSFAVRLLLRSGREADIELLPPFRALVA